MRRFVVAGVVIVACGVLAACGADHDDSARSAQTRSTVPVTTVARSAESFPANGVTESVLAIDNNFLPQTLSIVAGTEVVFENNGRNVHDVVPAEDKTAGAWGVLQADFEPGDTYSHVFATPGTYSYYCTIHGTATAAMFGSIVVTAP
jgi:plastocyanin